MAQQIVRKSQIKDRVGQQFGRLTVVRLDRVEKGIVRWLCSCTCGNSTVLKVSQLCRKDGYATRSCGCLKQETDAKTRLTHGQSGKRVPGTNKRIGRTREHRCWGGMIQRCTNQASPAWRNYGGRGIEVCERWRAFELFLEDMGKAPSSKHSLERKDNNGNYEPSNVVWANAKTQGRNTRRNRLLEFKGETLTLVEWAERIGTDSRFLSLRLDVLGWPVERALTEPAAECRKRLFTFRGETRSLKEWAEKIGVPYGTLYARVFNRKMSVDAALTLPPRGGKIK